MLALLLASPACGQALRSFDLARFEALGAARRTMVVQFYSDNCAVCPQQEEMLKRVASEPGPLTPAFFQVDFNASRDLREIYGVTNPSELLVFKGRALIGRGSGLYTERDIRALIRDSRMRARGRPRPRQKRTFRPKR